MRRNLTESISLPTCGPVSKKTWTDRLSLHQILELPTNQPSLPVNHPSLRRWCSSFTCHWVVKSSLLMQGALGKRRALQAIRQMRLTFSLSNCLLTVSWTCFFFLNWISNREEPTFCYSVPWLFFDSFCPFPKLSCGTVFTLVPSIWFSYAKDLLTADS